MESKESQPLNERQKNKKTSKKKEGKDLKKSIRQSLKEMQFNQVKEEKIRLKEEYQNIIKNEVNIAPKINSNIMLKDIVNIPKRTFNYSNAYSTTIVKPVIIEEVTTRKPIIIPINIKSPVNIGGQPINDDIFVQQIFRSSNPNLPSSNYSLDKEYSNNLRPNNHFLAQSYQEFHQMRQQQINQQLYNNGGQSHHFLSKSVEFPMENQNINYKMENLNNNQFSPPSQRIQQYQNKNFYYDPYNGYQNSRSQKFLINNNQIVQNMQNIQNQKILIRNNSEILQNINNIPNIQRQNILIRNNSHDNFQNMYNLPNIQKQNILNNSNNQNIFNIQNNQNINNSLNINNSQNIQNHQKIIIKHKSQNDIDTQKILNMEKQSNLIKNKSLNIQNIKTERINHNQNMLNKKIENNIHNEQNIQKQNILINNNDHNIKNVHQNIQNNQKKKIPKDKKPQNTPNIQKHNNLINKNSQNIKNEKNVQNINKQIILKNNKIQKAQNAHSSQNSQNIQYNHKQNILNKNNNQNGIDMHNSQNTPNIKKPQNSQNMQKHKILIKNNSQNFTQNIQNIPKPNNLLKINSLNAQKPHNKQKQKVLIKNNSQNFLNVQNIQQKILIKDEVKNTNQNIQKQNIIINNNNNQNIQNIQKKNIIINNNNNQNIQKEKILKKINSQNIIDQNILSGKKISENIYFSQNSFNTPDNQKDLNPKIFNSMETSPHHHIPKIQSLSQIQIKQMSPISHRIIRSEIKERQKYEEIKNDENDYNKNGENSLIPLKRRLFKSQIMLTSSLKPIERIQNVTVNNTLKSTYPKLIKEKKILKKNDDDFDTDEFVEKKAPRDSIRIKNKFNHF